LLNGVIEFLLLLGQHLYLAQLALVLSSGRIEVNFTILHSFDLNTTTDTAAHDRWQERLERVTLCIMLGRGSFGTAERWMARKRGCRLFVRQNTV
jgi:hypothetical protein